MPTSIFSSLCYTRLVNGNPTLLYRPESPQFRPRNYLTGAQFRSHQPRDYFMNLQNCSTVKSALTDLREILSRCHVTGADQLETSRIIANLEATISSIEEKSSAKDDIPAHRAVPIIQGLTAPAII